jgi:hypothetical protein
MKRRDLLTAGAASVVTVPSWVGAQAPAWPPTREAVKAFGRYLIPKSSTTFL